MWFCGKNAKNKIEKLMRIIKKYNNIIALLLVKSLE